MTSAPPRSASSVAVADRHDCVPGRPEPAEHVPLVRLAPVDQLLETEVMDMRRLQLAGRPQPGQRQRRVTAGHQHELGSGREVRQQESDLGVAAVIADDVIVVQHDDNRDRELG